MNYHIIDTEFNKKLSSAYQLSILAGMDSFVYTIQDSANQNTLLFRSYCFQNPLPEKPNFSNEIGEIFSKDELLSLLYRRVKVCLPFAPTVLVPGRLFNEKEKSTYIAALTDVCDANAIRTDELPELSLQVTYSINPTVFNELKKQFPNGQFYSPVSPFLLQCKQLKESSGGFGMFAHFHKDQLHLALFEKQSLVFFNSFQYNFADDVLYFLLLAYDQFKLDTKTVGLKLSGQIIGDSEIYKLLFRHISN